MIVFDLFNDSELSLSFCYYYRMALDDELCIAFLITLRWNNVPVCPYCQSVKCSSVHNHRYHCNSCNTAFSVTVRTIFHKSRLPISKWFEAISLVLSSPKYISSRKLSAAIGVNKHTGMRISTKINEALIDSNQRVLINGIYEYVQKWRD